MRRTGWFGSALFAGLLTLVMLPQPEQAATAPAQPSSGDRAFLEQALAINEGEVQLGRLAAERASTPEGKAMGETMVQNHTRLGQQLGEIAAQLGVSGSPELSSEQQEILARLRAQPRSEFDAAFKRAVDEGHVKELAMYRDQLGRTENPQLRAFSETRVEALQKSLGMATPAK